MKNSILSKVASTFTIFAMVLSMTPITVEAAKPIVGPGYLISGSATPNGMTVNVTGQASANPFTGQEDDQHVSVDWNIDQGATPSNANGDWERVLDITGNVDGTFASTTWSGSHTYTVPGDYLIFVRVHHAQAGGAESGSGQISFNVEIIQQCRDGVDNDNDTLIDFPNDPGCSSPTDDDEFNANVPPVISLVPSSVTIPELALYSFDANATDTDIPVQTLTFNLADGISGDVPSGASINSSTGVFSWTPTEAQGPAIYTFDVAVSDGESTASSTIIITVTEVNQAPIADNKNVVVVEDTPKTIELSGSDADLPSQDLAFSIVVQPTKGTLSVIDQDTGYVVYTPNANATGADSFTYRVTDDQPINNQSIPATVSINIDAVNDSPVLNLIGDETIPELSLFTFIASAFDVDGNTLTYTITSGDPDALVTPSGEFSWTPTEEEGNNTSYPFTIEVSDGTNSDSQIFNLTVTEVNQAPVLDVIGNKSVSEESELTFVISGTDADLPANTLTYSANSLPAGATFDQNTRTFSWIPTIEQAGNYQVEFTISDGLLNDTEIVPIDVGNVNRTPVLNTIGNKTINEGALLTFTISGSDPDGDPLTYSAEDLPSGASFDPDTQAFSWTPTFEQAGTYNVTFKVTDGSLSDEEEIVITVNETNRAPEASDQEVETNEDTPIAISLSAIDLDLDTLTFSIGDSAYGAFSLIDLDNGTLTYTPDLNYNGSDSFVFYASDGSANSNSATVSITINPINDAPEITLNGESDIALLQGNEYTEDGATCTDVEQGVLNVAIDGSVDVNTIGEYVLTYSCEDDEEETVQVTRTVEVQALPPACSDQSDNDQDSKVDLQDPGCDSPTDNNETDPLPPTPPTPSTPVVETSGGGFSGSRRHSSGGSSQGQVLGVSCGVYMDKFLREGSDNDSAQVTNLQNFLNKEMKAGLTVNGIYDKATIEAVNAFQIKYAEQILAPWKINAPTGLVYQTTLRWINMIECPELALEIPDLVEWSSNPNAPKVVRAATPAVAQVKQESTTSSQNNSEGSDSDDSDNSSENTGQTASVNEAVTGGFWKSLWSKVFGN